MEKGSPIDNLQDVLNQKDSILEPIVIDTSKTLINDFMIPPKDIVKSLVMNYVGYPKMIEILINLLKTSEILIDDSVGMNIDVQSERKQKEIDNFLLKFLSEMIEKNFDSKKLDSLLEKEDFNLDLLLKEPVFLTSINNLSKKYKDSLFLSKCLSSTMYNILDLDEVVIRESLMSFIFDEKLENLILLV